MPASLPRQLRRIAVPLLDQQLWYLGLDLRREDGNQPIAYGFRRVAAPTDRGATCYLLDARTEPDDAPCTIGVWGFGLCCVGADGEGTLVRRFGFTPRRPAPRADPLPAWSPDDVGPVTAHAGAEQLRRCWGLLAGACGAMADYETWALDRFGVHYRLWCLAGRPKIVRRRMLAPHLVPDRWRALAAWCRGAAATLGGKAGGTPVCDAGDMARLTTHGHPPTVR